MDSKTSPPQGSPTERMFTRHDRMSVEGSIEEQHDPWKVQPWQEDEAMTGNPSIAAANRAMMRLCASGLMIVGGLAVMPWTIFALALGRETGGTIGFATPILGGVVFVIGAGWWLVSREPKEGR